VPDGLPLQRVKLGFERAGLRSGVVIVGGQHLPDEKVPVTAQLLTAA
jgi:hypothetical protein